MLSISDAATALVHSTPLWSRPNLRTTPEALPTTAGTYVWFVQPDSLPLPRSARTGCVNRGELILVYVGETGPRSLGLRRRLAAHHSRDAGHSNFRLNLGTVLRNDLKITLRSTRSLDLIRGGEEALDRWLNDHA